MNGLLILVIVLASGWVGVGLGILWGPFPWCMHWRLRDIANEFCDRVERGEVRSRYTYGRMCKALGRPNTFIG